MNAVKKVSHFFDKLNDISGGITATLLVLVALAISVDVLLRYILGITFSGLFEISEFSLLWIAFLGAAWLLQKDGHINMDLILTHVKPKARAMTNIITYGVSTILFGMLTGYGIMVTWQDYQTNFIMGTVLAPPKWPIELIIPIGSFLLFIQLLNKTYAHVLNWKALGR